MVNIKADECLQCELVCSVNMLIYMLFSGTNLLLRVLGPSWGCLLGWQFVVQTSVCSEHPVTPQWSHRSWAAAVQKGAVCSLEWFSTAVWTAIFSGKHIHLPHPSVAVCAWRHVSLYFYFLSFIEIQNKPLVAVSQRWSLTLFLWFHGQLESAHPSFF